MSRKNKVASVITRTMATWSFIMAFLFLCLFEIWFNHSHLISSTIQFDPQTIILNLCLSLIAAIQGSIIMIDQRQADKARDETFNHILELETEILDRLKRIETKLFELEEDLEEHIEEHKEENN